MIYLHNYTVRSCDTTRSSSYACDTLLAFTRIFLVLYLYYLFNAVRHALHSCIADL